MSYVKKIVCLANSKMNGGRCVAGREIVDGEHGEWVRPVSGRNTREISYTERTYDNGQKAKVLDIIEIAMIKSQSFYHHVEDHQIDTGSKWKKIGTADWAKLKTLVESLNGTLWVNGHSTNEGLNDKIPWIIAKTLTSSIILIEPANFSVVISTDNFKKRHVRAEFSAAGSKYSLKITDMEAINYYQQKPDRTYSLENVIICISLARDSFYGNIYKLVAAIFTPNMKF